MQPFARQCLLPVVAFAAACTPRPEGPAVTYGADTSVAAYSQPADSAPYTDDPLKQMGEPPLPGAHVRPGVTVIRFFWSRSFHPDVAVRLVIEPKQCAVVTTVMTHAETLWGPPDSRGMSVPVGEAPGKLIRQDSVPLLVGDCKAMRSTFDRLGLWQVTSRPLGGVDGSFWRFERAQATGYTSVMWWSPSEAEGRPVWSAGLAMLKLAHALPSGPREIY